MSAVAAGFDRLAVAQAIVARLRRDVSDLELCYVIADPFANPASGRAPWAERRAAVEPLVDQLDLPSRVDEFVAGLVDAARDLR